MSPALIVGWLANRGNVIARLVNAEKRATAQGDWANLDPGFCNTLQVRSGPEQLS